MLENIPKLIEEIRRNLNLITAKEAAKKVTSERGILLDVREPSEVESKPTKADINIARGLLEAKMPQQFPDENLPIYIHCASGARATFAAEQLKRIGYKNVWVITCQVDEIIAAI